MVACFYEPDHEVFKKGAFWVNNLGREYEIISIRRYSTGKYDAEVTYSCKGIPGITWRKDCWNFQVNKSPKVNQ
jgi:hypothetical protein